MVKEDKLIYFKETDSMEKNIIYYPCNMSEQTVCIETQYKKENKLLYTIVFVLEEMNLQMDLIQ